MSFTHRARLVNPRLGTYFGIFMSAFVAIALLSLIFEGLGAPASALSLVMLIAPIALYATIGLAAFTREPIDYFAAGRRVPAFYSGIVLSQTALGATGMLALAGAFFVTGFDALCICIGALAGFVVMAVMLAPFFRKFGAFTIPSYLGRRFDSRLLRILAAAIFSLPMLLMLAAELRMGAYAASWLWSGDSRVMTALLAGVLVLTLAAGGMRSLTWSTVAESLAAYAALLVPVAVVAVIVTNLPIPQLSAGPVLRTLARAEAIQNVPIILPPTLAFDMPGEGLAPIAKRFADAFASVGPLAFVIVTLTMLAGVAGAPWLVPRVAATPGVYEARKSLGWATLLFGVGMLTLAAVGIFMRDYLMDVVTAPGSIRIPPWLAELKSSGIADFSTGSKRLDIEGIALKRDAVLLSLPIAAELPTAFVSLVAAGAVAASLAAAGAVTTALGNVLAEDIVHGLAWQPVPPAPRLFISRLALGVAALLGCGIAVLAPTDPLTLMLWAFALTASAAFPVLVLSIWWSRISVFGAVAGISAGFAVAVLAILAGEAGLIGLDSALAAALGIPASVIAIVVVTSVTPGPTKQVLDVVREIRVPGGEILDDREARLQRRQKRQTD